MRDREWRLALEEMADEWRAAWDREPPAGPLLALAALAADDDREPVGRRPVVPTV